MKVFLVVLCILQEIFCQNESQVILNLIENLEIRSCFFVYESENNLNLTYKILFTNIATAYVSHKKLIKLIESDEYHHAGTCIILKEIDFFPAVEIWKNLQAVNQAHKMSRYTWFVFTQMSELIFDPQKLKIPYNCEFIIIQPGTTSNYKLTEYYWATEKWFVKDFGTWKFDYGLRTTNISFHWRRLDLNRTKITILVNEYKDCENYPHLYECQTAILIQDFSRMMNFVTYSVSLYHDDLRNPSIWKENAANIIIFPQVEYGLFPEPSYELYYNYKLGPLYKVKYHWYIKYPSQTLRSDYFIQPFHKNLWTAIILLILVGSAFIIILSKQNALPVDNTFLILESLCNQSGNDNIESIRLRIICILSRFTAVIITASFGAVITSFLSVKIIQKPFTNVDEFVENGQYKLCLYYPAATFSERYISAKYVPVYENFFRDYVVFYHVNFSSNKAMHEMICSNDRLVVQGDDNHFQNYVTDTNRRTGSECNIYRILNPIGVVTISFPLELFSPFMDVFNHNLLKFNEFGIKMKMQQIVLNDSITIEKNENTFQSVELVQMTLLLSIPFIGILLAALIVIMEFIYKRVKKC